MSRYKAALRMENWIQIGMATVFGFLLGRNRTVAKITTTINIISQIGYTAIYNWSTNNVRHVKLKIKGIGHTGPIMTPPVATRPMMNMPYVKNT